MINYLFKANLYLKAKASVKQGKLNAQTLSAMSASLTPLDNNASKWLQYALLQRSITGEVDEPTLQHLQTVDILKQSKASAVRLLNLLPPIRREEFLSKKAKQQQTLANASPLIASSLVKINTEGLSENTRRLAMIHDLQSAWRDDFFSYLQGKHIAIVGNAGSIKGTHYGNHIDEHQVVCRFNSFSTSNTNDLGQRIDVWVTSPDMLNKRLSLPNNLKWIVISGPDVRYTLLNWEGAINYQLKGCKILTLPLAVWNELVSILEAPPSAGIALLKWLISERQFSDTLSIFGFDYDNVNTKHYHARSSKLQAGKRHAWVKEKNEIKRYEAGGFITLFRGNTT